MKESRKRESKKFRDRKKENPGNLARVLSSTLYSGFAFPHLVPFPLAKISDPLSLRRGQLEVISCEEEKRKERANFNAFKLPKPISEGNEQDMTF